MDFWTRFDLWTRRWGGRIILLLLVVLFSFQAWYLLTHWGR